MRHAVTSAMTHATKRHIGGGITNATIAETRGPLIIRDGAPVLLATYAIGDYVVPTDLPRQFLCRVSYAHVVDGTPLQVLELAPLAGPWPRGTRLVRGSDWVRPAVVTEIAGFRRRRDPAMRSRRRRRTADQPGATRLFPKRTQSSSSTPIGTPIK